MLSQAAEEVRKLGEKIKLTPKEDQAQSGYRMLAIRLREDNDTPTCLASLRRPDCSLATRFQTIPARWHWAISPSLSSAADFRPSVNLLLARLCMPGVVVGR